MKELQASRVVVIDDDAEEGDGLRRALTRGGIPSLVFATLEDLPPDRLTGVRLAALDADLTGTFATAPDDQVTDPTARMLAQLLSTANGPYHALIWTKHTELADSLVDRLTLHGVRPAAWTTLAKEEVRSNGNWDLLGILERIQESRSNKPGLSFLSEWEAAVVDAGVATIHDLLRNATETKVLRALAYVERPTASAPERLRAVTESLSRLHADSLDRQPDQHSPEVVAQLFDGSIPEPTEELIAQLHSNLLLRAPETGASPGSIYILDSIASRLGRPKWFPSMEQIELDLGGDAKLIKDLDATPVAVEVTPLCDAHRKTRIARFLVGIAVPISELSNTKKNGLRSLKSQAFLNLGPLMIPELGHIDIVWCTRLAFTSPIERVKTLMPIRRLRYDVLVNLQSWSSAQASRPGYLSIST